MIVSPERTSLTQWGGVWLPVQLEVLAPVELRTWNWNLFPPVMIMAALAESAARLSRIMMPPLELLVVFWTPVIRATISPSPDIG